MKPLLRIQTIPIKIEAQTKRASLQFNDAAALPTVDISRRRGQNTIQTTPPKMSIDTTEARANAGLKSAPRQVREAAQAGMSAASEATANYAEETAQLRGSHGKGDPLIDIAVARANAPVTNPPSYSAKQAPDISVEPGSISFDYQMDSLTFDWNVTTKPQLEYIPPSLDFSITQYPEVIIEYIGEPIYVPASANPNYKK